MQRSFQHIFLPFFAEIAEELRPDLLLSSRLAKLVWSSFCRVTVLDLEWEPALDLDAVFLAALFSLSQDFFSEHTYGSNPAGSSFFSINPFSVSKFFELGPSLPCRSAGLRDAYASISDSDNPQNRASSGSFSLAVDSQYHQSNLLLQSASSYDQLYTSRATSCFLRNDWYCPYHCIQKIQCCLEPTVWQTRKN